MCGEQIYGEVFQAEHPQEIIDRANEAWNTLPLEVRQQFGNDVKRFTREGETWLKNKLPEFVKQNMTQQQEPEPQPTNNDKGANE